MKSVWIVDGAYLMKAAPGRFDYLRLKAELEQRAGQPFFESYYLNSTPNSQTDPQDAFHAWLKGAAPRSPKMRVQLYRLKDLQCVCPTCAKQFPRQVQKGVDVGIATLILKLATQDQYEQLFLSAGDGDFEDAIDYAKSELHKKICIAGFQNTVSVDLQSYADCVYWIDDFWERIKKVD